MLILKNTNTYPYYNLALEEYAIDNIPGDIFMLWQNERSVIIGRAQNAYAELDHEFIAANNIAVVRRLTGGGAVFHDIGNVNYTFITAGGGAQLDFARFCTPIIDALSALGVHAELSGRNDITVDGMKISGTAQCSRSGRTLHHGTLLFDADLASLAGALRPDPAKLKSKGIESVRSRVTNIRPLLERDMDTSAFISFVERSVTDSREGCTYRELTGDEKAAVRQLTETKYSTWEWNYGQSRQYDRREKKRFAYGTVEVEASYERGVITAVKISGDFFGVREISELEAALTGVRCERAEIENKLKEAEVGRYIAGASAGEIAGLFI